MRRFEHIDGVEITTGQSDRAKAAAHAFRELFSLPLNPEDVDLMVGTLLRVGADKSEASAEELMEIYKEVGELITEEIHRTGSVDQQG